jgi:hypothetical protein
MANNVNIFDKYGIKEVANVYFEALDDDSAAGVYAGDIVLFLDTLKVSTIETTAENTAAQGGWGNPKLVQWDYGKEINITLEDALMSLESLRFMLGGAIKKPTAAGDKVIVRHTEEVVVDASGKVPAPKDHLTGKVLYPKATYGHPIRLINLGGGTDSTTAGARTQIVVDTVGGEAQTMTALNNIKFKNPAAGINELTAPTAGDHIRIFWEVEVASDTTDESAVEVTISPDTFPGTYRVVGDTFMRSEKTGKDEPFQFIINKAKVQSNVTITLQAEGDPSTFEMTLNVLRSTNDAGQNEMMKLVRYNLEDGSSSGVGDDKGSLTAGSGQ